MLTKRLSANGVFQAKKNITKSSFLEQCIKNLYCGESTIKRFWEAKEKISANIYDDCCDLAQIDPNLSEDRTPFKCIIPQATLEAKLYCPQEKTIECNLYNHITIFNLQPKLEANIIVITGKWSAKLRDDYYDIPEEIKVFLNLCMVAAGVEVVTIKNKKFFQVSSSGDFCLKYLLIWQNYQINLHPFDVSITADNQLHNCLFENLTKYHNRISKPIEQSQILTQEVLLKVFEQAVTHKFFKLTSFSIDNNSMVLEIDESYPENKVLVETELKMINKIS